MTPQQQEKTNGTVWGIMAILLFIVLPFIFIINVLGDLEVGDQICIERTG